MAANDAQERTEEATPKRLEDARRKGQVARSRELVTLAMIATALGSSAVFGPGTAHALAAVMRDSFSPGVVPRGFDLFGFLGDRLLEVTLAGAPLLAAMGAVAFLGTVAVGGWNFSSEAVRFDLEKVDPVKGLGRIFSLRTLVELIKASLKFLLVGGISAAWLWFNAEAFVGLPSSSVMEATDEYISLLGSIGLAMLAPLLLIAAIDAPYQLWNHARQLRMTRRELKDDLKDSEGNPELKGKLRRRQQEAAQRRMLADVPDASVVVTNPTHFAVALRYDPDTMRAPVVTAKGVDAVAFNIRRVAQQSGVPMVEAPPLARALFHNVRLGQPIPEALYLAVAKVLAYVHELRKAGIRRRTPSRLRGVEVPAEMRGAAR